MPLIAKVPFVSGAVFTPEVATEMTGITFDDQPSYVGHFNKILDSDLSDAAGQIKQRLGTLGLNLKVTAGSGLNANYASGSLLYGTTIFTIGSSSITLTASSVNYIYGSLSGTIVATTGSPPIIRALLATVTTNTTGVINVTDFREGVSVEVVKPYNLSIRNFGGRGDQGDFVAGGGGDTFGDGEYYLRNFTVPSGQTVTITRLAYIYCSGNVSILGNVIVTPASVGGGGVLGASTNMCIAGQGLGGAVNELSPLTYNFRASPIGSGGSSGFVFGNSNNKVQVNASFGAGGAGGGGVIFEVDGSVNISGSIIADGVNGTISQLDDQGGIRHALGGGGGGSGGSITIKSLGALIVSGTLRANAGSGGNGALGNATLSAEGGAGGGGGIITLQSPAINTTGATLLVNGGAGGSPGGAAAVVHRGFGGVGGAYGGISGSFSGDGGAGGTGVIRTQAFAPIG